MKEMDLATMVLVRHGQSQWNLENRFTGWVDVPLSIKGREEAIAAGKKLKDMRFDTIYVSHLMRAIQTMHYILLELSDTRTPIVYHEEKRIHEWEHYSGNRDKEIPIYQSVDLAERFYGDLQGESLKDTCERTIPYYKNHIVPELQAGKIVLIVAHGNSLRSITKYVENISDKEIPNVEIPTGVPIIYTLDPQMKLQKKVLLE
jgi:2,3-bisphosphoglycerate-dependent phosphoglycerate mutase